MKARYYKDGNAIDYIPGSNVSAGDVVFLGSLAGIAKLDIKAGELGSLSTEGVYEVLKDSAAISAGAEVYWNGSAGKCTATSTAYHLGVAVKAAGASDTVAYVKINVGAVPESQASSSAS